MRTKLEYIWLDGYTPTQNMRSKTKVVEGFDGKLESCLVWAFDGSSTRHAEGDSSDCLIKPVAIYPNPARNNGYLVMTEVLNSDGSPHVSNGRSLIDDDDKHILEGDWQLSGNWEYPFRRYKLAGYNKVIKDVRGNVVDLDRHTIQNHFKMLGYNEGI